MRRAAAAVVGADPFDLADVLRRVAGAVGHADIPDLHGLTGGSTPEKSLLRGYSPLEVGCLDPQGQLPRRPLWGLLRGRARGSVAFSAYLFFKVASHPPPAPGQGGGAVDPARPR